MADIASGVILENPLSFRPSSTLNPYDYRSNWGLIKDSFVLDTSAGQAVKHWGNTGFSLHAPEEEYAPIFDDAIDLDNFDLQLWRLIRNSRSRAETASILKRYRVNSEIRNRLDMNSAAWTRFLSAFMDPINYIPLPGIGGVGFFRGIAKGAFYVGSANAATEIYRSEVDPTDTPLELGLNITAGALFGAALGGPIGAIARRSQLKALSGNGDLDRVGQRYNASFQRSVDEEGAVPIGEARAEEVEPVLQQNLSDPDAVPGVVIPDRPEGFLINPFDFTKFIDPEDVQGFLMDTLESTNRKRSGLYEQYANLDSRIENSSLSAEEFGVAVKNRAKLKKAISYMHEQMLFNDTRMAQEASSRRSSKGFNLTDAEGAQIKRDAPLSQTAVERETLKKQAISVSAEREFLILSRDKKMAEVDKWNRELKLAKAAVEKAVRNKRAVKALREKVKSIGLKIQGKETGIEDLNQQIDIKEVAVFDALDLVRNAENLEHIGSSRIDGPWLKFMRWTGHPWYFVKNNRLPGRLGERISRLADDIAAIPGLRLAGAKEGIAANPSVEIAAQAWMGVQQEVSNEISLSYLTTYLKRDVAKQDVESAIFSTKVKQGVQNVGRKFRQTFSSGRGETIDAAAGSTADRALDQKLTYTQFLDAVGRYAIDADPKPNPDPDLEQALAESSRAFEDFMVRIEKILSERGLLHTKENSARLVAQAESKALQVGRLIEAVRQRRAALNEGNDDALTNFYEADKVKAVERGQSIGSFEAWKGAQRSVLIESEAQLDSLKRLTDFELQVAREWDASIDVANLPPNEKSYFTRLWAILKINKNPDGLKKIFIDHFTENPSIRIGPKVVRASTAPEDIEARAESAIENITDEISTGDYAGINPNNQVSRFIDDQLREVEARLAFLDENFGHADNAKFIIGPIPNLISSASISRPASSVALSADPERIINHGTPFNLQSLVDPEDGALVLKSSDPNPDGTDGTRTGIYVSIHEPYTSSYAQRAPLSPLGKPRDSFFVTYMTVGAKDELVETSQLGARGRITEPFPTPFGEVVGFTLGDRSAGMASLIRIDRDKLEEIVAQNESLTLRRGEDEPVDKGLTAEHLEDRIVSGEGEPFEIRLPKEHYEIIQLDPEAAKSTEKYLHNISLGVRTRSHHEIAQAFADQMFLWGDDVDGAVRAFNGDRQRGGREIDASKLDPEVRQLIQDTVDNKILPGLPQLTPFNKATYREIHKPLIEEWLRHYQQGRIENEQLAASLEDSSLRALLNKKDEGLQAVIDDLSLGATEKEILDAVDNFHLNNEYSGLMREVIVDLVGMTDPEKSVPNNWTDDFKKIFGLTDTDVELQNAQFFSGITSPGLLSRILLRQKQLAGSFVGSQEAMIPKWIDQRDASQEEALRTIVESRPWPTFIRDASEFQAGINSTRKFEGDDSFGRFEGKVQEDGPPDQGYGGSYADNVSPEEGAESDWLRNYIGQAKDEGLTISSAWDIPEWAKGPPGESKLNVVEATILARYGTEMLRNPHGVIVQQHVLNERMKDPSFMAVLEHHPRAFEMAKKMKGRIVTPEERSWIDSGVSPESVHYGELSVPAANHAVDVAQSGNDINPLLRPFLDRDRETNVTFKESGEGHAVHAYINYDDSTGRFEILLDEKAIRAQWNALPMTGIAKQWGYAFDTEDLFIDFVRRHYLAHTRYARAEGESVKGYTARINDIAWRGLRNREAPRTRSSEDMQMERLKLERERLLRLEHDEKMKVGHALPSALLSRRLDIPNKLVADYIETNVETVMRAYINRIGPVIEMAKRFGDHRMSDEFFNLDMEFNEALLAASSPKEAARLKKEYGNARESLTVLRDKVLKTYGIPKDASRFSVRAARILKNNAIVSQMGASIYAAFADTGRVVMDEGMHALLDTGRKSFFEHRKDPESAFRRNSEDALASGVARELVQAQRIRSILDQDSSPHFSKFEEVLDNATRSIFVVNGLSWWTDTLSLFASTMIINRVFKTIPKILDNTATQEEIAEMADFGIDALWARRYMTAWQKVGSPTHDGLAIADTKKWLDQTAAVRFRTNLATLVQQQVLSPTIADRPTMMSKPMAQMFLRYKTFRMASTSRIIFAGLQQKHAHFMQGLVSMVVLGLVVDWMKRPDYVESDWDEMIFNAVDQSGVGGIFMDFNNMAERASGGDFGLRPMFGVEGFRNKDQGINNIVSGLGVPAVSQWSNLVWAFSEGAASDRAAAIRYLWWYNNVHGVREIVNEIQHGAAEAFQ